MIKQKGFTITELMFAMTFLAVLLLIILGSIIQITRTYNKGITLKRVNQSGRTVGAELQRAIQPTSISSVGNNLNIDRLCFGNTSFAWLNSSSGDWAKGLNRYTDDDTQIKGFLKVNENLCGLNWTKKIPRDKATQLLDDGLVMQSVQLPPPLPINGKLVSLRYTISTPSEGLIDAGSCAGDDDFCALNQFNVTVYARGY